jgi:serine/threonine protein kinase
VSTYRIARRLSAAAGVLESFLGVESATDRPVIVKRLVSPWVKEAPAFGTRFVQTLTSMRGVEGLPEWLEVGVGRDSVWLVHALAEGESLRTVMNALAQQRGFISPSEGLGVVGQLATMLRDLHARDLVHGDLSASNVLLTPDGQVLLLDAGVTLSLSPSNQVGPARAEAFTLAPEQLTQTPSKATDLFRLGLLLHELATGTPLFYATDAVQSMVLCQRFMGLARDQVKQVPEPWQTVIIELLSIEPRERPSAVDVDAALTMAAQRAGWKNAAEERARLFARACGNRQTLESLARGGTQELVLTSLITAELPPDVDDTSDEPTTGIFSSLPGTPPTSPTVSPEPVAPPSGAVSLGVAVVGRISTRKMSHSELAAARQEQRPTPPTPAAPRVVEPAEDPNAPKDLRIGELLVEKGQITREQLLEAIDQVQRLRRRRHRGHLGRRDAHAPHHLEEAR